MCSQDNLVNIVNIYNYWPHFNNTVFISCRDGDGVEVGGGGDDEAAGRVGRGLARDPLVLYIVTLYLNLCIWFVVVPL